MTREEAIYRLKNTAWLGSDDDREEAEEAVVVAIKALEDIERWRTWSHTYDNLISRQDAIDVVGYEIDGGYNAIVDRIKALPSADRPTGEWICMGDVGVTECNQCGWSIEEYVGDYKFCPNCGAKMRGEEE